MKTSAKHYGLAVGP